jgi:hypothetical protein
LLPQAPVKKLWLLQLVFIIFVAVVVLIVRTSIAN